SPSALHLSPQPKPARNPLLPEERRQIQKNASRSWTQTATDSSRRRSSWPTARTRPNSRLPSRRRTRTATVRSRRKSFWPTARRRSNLLPLRLLATHAGDRVRRFFFREFVGNLEFRPAVENGLAAEPRQLHQKDTNIL